MKKVKVKRKKAKGGVRDRGKFFRFTFCLLLCLSLCLCVSAVKIPAQTGGGFDLSHSVIATGGATSTGSAGGQTFRVDGTAGQNLAGTVSIAPNGTGGAFSLRGGFWAFDQLAPTAANVSISGRVLSAFGQPIFRVKVVLTDSSGTSRSVQSNQFGYYRIDEIPAGETYVITAVAKQFQFVSQIVNVDEELTEFDITALP